MNKKYTFQRRDFLKKSLILSFPSIVPASVFGQDAPSKKITIGLVGCGGMGLGNARSMMDHGGFLPIAACDVDRSHLLNAVNQVNAFYKTNSCTAYSDYRELMADKSIDAVMLAVPDHWHGLISVEAANQKKDIYGEKPLARTIKEQQAIVAAVEKNQVIWQTGSWQRSTANFHAAVQIVRNGLLGKISRIEVGLPSGHADLGKTGNKQADSVAPENLDYEKWIGPAEIMPYNICRTHKNWRWNYNTGGGQLLDWVGHHVDIAHWGMNWDRSGPLSVKTIECVHPVKSDVWNTATKFKTELVYPGGVTMMIAGGYVEHPVGCKWIGEKGTLFVGRKDVFECSIPEFTKKVKVRNDKNEVKEVSRFVRLGADIIKNPIDESSNHFVNFYDCIVSRKETITPVHAAHHSAIPGHISLISMLLNRDLQWDSATETFVNDAEANVMLSRPYREPWKI
jgi:predicted dehydrogenase